MVTRRAKAAGIKTKIGIHTFRAAGITTFLTKRRHARERGIAGESRIDPNQRSFTMVGETPSRSLK